MKKYEEIKEMLCEELEKIADGGQLTPTTLDMVDKLTHSLKSLSTVMAMEDYSEDDYYDGNSMARNRKRTSDGRYSSRGSYERGNRRRSYDGYSGHDDFKTELHEMMEETNNEQERMAIRKVLKMME